MLDTIHLGEIICSMETYIKIQRAFTVFVLDGVTFTLISAGHLILAINTQIVY